MSKLKELPENFTNLNEDLAAKKIELDEMMSAKLIEKIEHGNIDSHEINKIKMTGEANTVRLDKIQKDEKMLIFYFRIYPLFYSRFRAFHSSPITN